MLTQQECLPFFAEDSGSVVDTRGSIQLSVSPDPRHSMPPLKSAGPCKHTVHTYTREHMKYIHN